MMRFLRQAALVIAVAATAGSAEAATFRLGLSSLPPGNGNPFASPARTTWYTLRAVFDMLTALGPGMRPVPALALSWHNTDDITWVVNLRPGVTFSNGEPCDADAVVATYTYLKSADAAADSLPREVANIAGVRALDKTTVEFKTVKPDPAFARQMAVVPIVPPELWRKVGRAGFMLAPVGTGPFKVETWGKTQIVMSAFKDSWRKSAVDRLEIVALPEQAARIQALLSGRIDVASEIGPEDMDALTGAGFTIYQRPASSVEVIAFNSTKAGSPFHDTRVRQAMSYAVNRDAIAQVITHGLVPAAAETASRGNGEYDPALKGYPFDPAKAKALLAEAGYPNGFSFVHEHPAGVSGSNMPATLEQVASDLAKVGVKMIIREIPWAQYVRSVNQGDWQGESFTFEYETLPTGDVLRPYRLHSCAWSHPWFCDQQVMPLIEAAKTTFDPARRASLIKQILARTNAEAPTLLLYEPLGLDGVSAKVTGFSEENAIIPFDKLSVRN